MVAFVFTAMMIGFVGGFATFKRSHRWCPGCGSMLRCGECPRSRTATKLRPEAVGEVRYR
jgi:NADH pyrophosphatase NudC (nudix superfamily)